MSGPISPRALGLPLGLDHETALHALVDLEGEGVVLRGWFTPGGIEEEWCDRRLLARIHRATLQKLRAEIQPVSPADFMRFLFEWQHLTPSSRLNGVDGLRAAIVQLDGFELAADAWDKHVLPARVTGYDGTMLDLLCFSGEAAWTRLTPPPSVDPSAALPPRPIRSTPVALLLREHLRSWSAIAHDDSSTPRAPVMSDAGRRVLGVLSDGGAQFAHEIAAAAGLPLDEVRDAVAELVWAGAIASDGFSGLRAIWSHDAPTFQSRAGRPSIPAGGRWSQIAVTLPSTREREEATERYAWALLRRYGIVCRRLLMREPFAIAWRDLLKVYRRLEARGEVRGGRFVSGLPGEQFALPEAVELARRIRRTPPSGETIVLSAADPLNLCGVVTAGDRIPAIASARVTFRDGVPIVDQLSREMAPA
jgi:ATP-dependent Lhr-like helicase